MYDGASEILGYFNEGSYIDVKADSVKTLFNTKYSSVDDEFSPQMFKLRDQQWLDQYMTLANSIGGIMVLIFILAMSVVLWNTGLLGGLRRYS